MLHIWNDCPSTICIPPDLLLLWPTPDWIDDDETIIISHKHVWYTIILRTKPGNKCKKSTCMCVCSCTWAYSGYWCIIHRHKWWMMRSVLRLRLKLFETRYKQKLHVVQFICRSTSIFFSSSPQMCKFILLLVFELKEFYGSNELFFCVIVVFFFYYFFSYFSSILSIFIRQSSR